MQPIHQFHNWVSQPRMPPQWEQHLGSPHPSIWNDSDKVSQSCVLKWDDDLFSELFKVFNVLCVLWMPHGKIGTDKSRAYEVGLWWFWLLDACGKFEGVCRVPRPSAAGVPFLISMRFRPQATRRAVAIENLTGGEEAFAGLYRWLDDQHYDKISAKNLRHLPHQQPPHLQGRILAGCPANLLPHLAWTYVWELSTKLGQNLHDWLHSVMTK